MNKTIEHIKPFLKEFGMNDCFRSAVFASGIKLISSPTFDYEKIVLKSILKYLGCRYDKKKKFIDDRSESGKIDTKNFVDKWLDRIS